MNTDTKMENNGETWEDFFLRGCREYAYVRDPQYKASPPPSPDTDPGVIIKEGNVIFVIGIILVVIIVVCIVCAIVMLF